MADEQVDPSKPVEARAVPEHWLDKTLRVMGSGRPASELMEMVWQAYEVTTAAAETVLNADPRMVPASTAASSNI